MNSQRRFAVMGENLFKIANKLVTDQTLCRLLKYQDPDPLNTEKYEDVNGVDLLHKQIIIVPKFPEEGIECSFVMAVFDNFTINKPSDNKLVLQLIASSSSRSQLYGPMKLVVDLEFNTPDTIIPMDTLDYVAGDELNTFSAGTVDLAAQTFGGSRMLYYLSSSLQEEVWQWCHAWRIKSGKFLMDNNGGFLTTGNLHNGKYFSITCTLPGSNVENVVFDKAHVEKLMREGQIIIRIDGVEYDIQGRVINQ